MPRLEVRTTEGVTLDLEVVGAGTRFTATLEANLVGTDGKVVAERGATVYGQLAQAQSAGRLAGRSQMTMILTDILIDNQLVPVRTSSVQAVSQQSSGGSTARNVGAGAAVGVNADHRVVDSSVVDGSESHVDEAAGLESGERQSVAGTAVEDVREIKDIAARTDSEISDRVHPRGGLDDIGRVYVLFAYKCRIAIEERPRLSRREPVDGDAAWVVLDQILVLEGPQTRKRCIGIRR